MYPWKFAPIDWVDKDGQKSTDHKLDMTLEQLRSYGKGGGGGGEVVDKTAGTIITRYFAAHEITVRNDQGGRPGGGGGSGPSQVRCAEKERTGAAAKFTTAFGAPERQPEFRQRQGGFRTRFERIGGRRCDGPATAPQLAAAAVSSS